MNEELKQARIDAAARAIQEHFGVGRDDAYEGAWQALNASDKVVAMIPVEQDKRAQHLQVILDDRRPDSDDNMLIIDIPISGTAVGTIQTGDLVDGAPFTFTHVSTRVKSYGEERTNAVGT